MERIRGVIQNTREISQIGEAQQNKETCTQETMHTHKKGQVCNKKKWRLHLMNMYLYVYVYIRTNSLFFPLLFLQ